MKEQIEAFLEHLRLNENASLHTVRAYESDLAQFLDVRRRGLGPPPRGARCPPTSITSRFARFLGDLHKRGNTRSSAARKLAAIRALGRYLRREGVVEGDPAALVGTPRREHRLPAHLGEAEMSPAARDAGRVASRSAGAIAPSSSCSTPQACA